MRSVSACAQGALSLCSEPLPLSPVLSHSPIGEPLRHRSFAMSSTDSNRKSFGISGTIQKHFRLRWLMLSIRAWSPRVHVWFVWHSSDSLVWFSRLILSSGSLVWFSCLLPASGALVWFMRWLERRVSQWCLVVRCPTFMDHLSRTFRQEALVKMKI